MIGKFKILKKILLKRNFSDNKIKTDSTNEILNKIIKEEEEESIQNKYKEYNEIMKNKEALRRKEDVDVYNILKGSSIPFKDIPRIVLQRNFLKKKKENDPEKNNEINLDILNKINQKEPVSLYEIDLETYKIYNNVDIIIKIYSLLTVVMNSAFILNFDFLFSFTDWAYFSCYITNSFLFTLILLNKKVKNRVLSIEYLNEEKVVKIITWKKYGKGKIERIIKVEELEMFTSQKILENGINLKHKKEVYWLGSIEQEGIWHNKTLFENLFGKIEEEKEDYFEE